MSTSPSPRLLGLDLARTLAYLGMIAVNFHIVMGGGPLGDPALTTLFDLFEGKAAATFVTLAGLGLGLQAQKQRPGLLAETLLRAALLFAIGLMNNAIFSADILHFYGVYFALGALVMGLRPHRLFLLALLIFMAFSALYFTVPYSLGWDFDTLTYHGLDQVEGFCRNLFYNGWHPVVPWFAFFVLGLGLSHLLTDPARAQNAPLGLSLLGLVITVSADLVAKLLKSEFAAYPELASFWGTAPLPPGPLYVLTGMGAAMATIGLCLWLCQAARRLAVLDRGLEILAAPGRMTLTLYVAHIFVGMSVLEALHLAHAPGFAPPPDQVLEAIGTWMLAAIVFANLWQGRFARGPLEGLMQQVVKIGQPSPKPKP